MIASRGYETACQRFQPGSHSSRGIDQVATEAAGLRPFGAEHARRHRGGDIMSMRVLLALHHRLAPGGGAPGATLALGAALSRSRLPG